MWANSQFGMLFVRICYQELGVGRDYKKCYMLYLLHKYKVTKKAKRILTPYDYDLVNLSLSFVVYLQLQSPRQQKLYNISSSVFISLYR